MHLGGHILAHGLCQGGDGLLITQLFCQCLYIGRLFLSGHINGQFLCIVRGADLGAQLVAGTDGETVVVVGEAEEGGEAPGALYAVEAQVDEVDGIGCTGRTNSLDETTVIAVVVVGTDTDSCREVVVDLAGDVQLTTVDILLTLHIGDVGVILGHHTLLSEHGTDGHFEHGDTLVVFHKATATHDTDHRGEGPHIFLITGKEGGHDGG